MLAALALAGALRASPSPTPAPNPCAHRIFCGPLHLIPRSAAQRERLAAQLIASIVEWRAWSAQRSSASISVPVVDGATGMPTGAVQRASVGFVGGSARPIAISLGTYLIGDAIEHAAQSALHEPTATRARWARIDAIAALGDATQWASTFRTVHAAQRSASACQALLDRAPQAVTFSISPFGPNMPGGMASSAPGWVCGDYIGGTGPYIVPGHAPLVGVFLAPSSPIALPSRRGMRWSVLALAAQATIEPAAHALRDIGPLHLLPRGPVRLLPRTLVERRALYLDAGVALLDGLITAHGTRGDPAAEGNPAMRPFIRGGVGMILSAFVVQTIAERTISRRWAPQQRALLLDRDADAHVSGVASWLSPMAYSWSPYMAAGIMHGPIEERDWSAYDFCDVSNGAPCAPEK